jgi:hypothetical protein
MSDREITIGHTYGSWTVVGARVGREWPCKCACGTNKMVRTSQLHSCRGQCRKCHVKDLVARNRVRRTFVPSEPNEPKTCARCKSDKPRRDFGAGKRHSDGLYPWCRSCASAYQNDRWRARPLEERRALTAAAAGRRNANEEARRKFLTNHQLYTLRGRYGIDTQTLLTLLERQGGVCAICKQAPGPGRRRGLVVDHDHQTGVVRGLLCNGCNTGLGNFQDSAELLLEASMYLASSRSRLRTAT